MTTIKYHMYYPIFMACMEWSCNLRISYPYTVWTWVSYQAISPTNVLGMRLVSTSNCLWTDLTFFPCTVSDLLYASAEVLILFLDIFLPYSTKFSRVYKFNNFLKKQFHKFAACTCHTMAYNPGLSNKHPHTDIHSSSQLSAKQCLLEVTSLTRVPCGFSSLFRILSINTLTIRVWKLCVACQTFWLKYFHNLRNYKFSAIRYMQAMSLLKGRTVPIHNGSYRL